MFYRWRQVQRDRQGYFVERSVSLSFGYPVMELELPMISVDLDDDSIPNIDPLRSTECCMNLYVGEKYSDRLEEIYNRSIEIGKELAVWPDVMFLEKGKILNHQNGLVPLLVRKFSSPSPSPLNLSQLGLGLTIKSYGPPPHHPTTPPHNF